MIEIYLNQKKLGYTMQFTSRFRIADIDWMDRFVPPSFISLLNGYGNEITMTFYQLAPIMQSNQVSGIWRCLVSSVCKRKEGLLGQKVSHHLFIIKREKILVKMKSQTMDM